MPIFNNITITAGGETPDMYVAYAIEDVDGVKTLSKSGSKIGDLSDAVDFPDSVLYYAFSHDASITGQTVDLSSAKTVGSSAFYQAFTSSAIAGVVFPSSFTSVGAYAFQAAFQGTHISGSITINCENIGASAFNNAFGSTDITSFSYSGPLNGNAAMCMNCTSLTTVAFGLDTTIAGTNPNLFANDTAITSADLSGIVSIAGGAWSYPLQYIFDNCPLITTINMASLVSIGTYGLRSTFRNMLGLADLYFPSLYDDSFGGYNTVFYNMLTGVDNCTLHFPNNLSETWLIENLQTYNETAPFGATAGSVVYDLPATVTLVGGSGDTYYRNPKFDTQDALAWFQGSSRTEPNARKTPFYTNRDNGSTYGDPNVGEDIYTDAELTDVFDTIDDIQ